MPPSSVSYSPAPSLRVVPRKAVDFSLGELAVSLATSYGLKADDWQADPICCIYARRKDQRWAAATTKISVARQNGKNGVIEVVELFGMVVLGLKFLHTAHEVKTARKAFRRLLSFFENAKDYPELAELVLEIRKTNGQEAIVLKNGGSVEFIARSSGSGRGFTVDVLVCDEDQDLTDDELAALLPTISAAPSGNPMVILTGTPPDPEKAHLSKGEVARRVRQDAINGTDPDLCCFDWGVPDGPLPDVTDQALWYATNPALGIRLNIAEVRRELKMMSPETFARERLGWWGDPAEEVVGDVLVPYPAWQALTNESARMQKVQAFAIEVTKDRQWAYVAAAGQHDATKHAVELVPWSRSGLPEPRNGIAWVLDRARELDKSHGPAPWVVDAGGPAGDLIAPLQAAGLQVVPGDVHTVRSATAGFVDAVTESTVLHGPQTVLDDAVKRGVKRPLGDGGFAISRTKSPVDVTPLIAVTLALWSARNVRPPEVYSIGEMMQQLIAERAAAASTETTEPLTTEPPETTASTPSQPYEGTPGVTFHAF